MSEEPSAAGRGPDAPGTRSGAPESGGAATSSRHAGLALAVVMIGVLITAVDTTIVILALPEIERSLHLPVTSVVWVIIAYLLVITLLATQVGKLGDMFGRVRMYEAGFLIFIVGSALCAIATSETTMVVFRILQGVGGAFITANSGAVIADNFPPEKRGRAYGFNAVGWSAGAVLGILLGGAIVTYISWRWVFWINVPIGIAALALALRVLRDRGERVRHRLDIPGMLTFGLGLFGLLWVVTELAARSMDTGLYVWLAVGVVMLVAFVFVERARAEPMISVGFFRRPTMTPTLAASLVQSLGNYAVLFLIIMYLQGVRHLTPLHAAILLVPGYVLGSIFGPYAGKLADRFGPALPATVGLAVEVVALAMYAQLGATTGEWLVVLAAIVNGIGGTLFFPANNAAVMHAARGAAFGVAAGMLRTFANIGMVFSFSVAILVTSHAIPRGLAFAIFVGTTTLRPSVVGPFTTGLHAAFYASMGLMALAAVLSSSRLLSKHGRNPPAAGSTTPVAGAQQPEQAAMVQNMTEERAQAPGFSPGVDRVRGEAPTMLRASGVSAPHTPEGIGQASGSGRAARVKASGQPVARTSGELNTSSGSPSPEPPGSGAPVIRSDRSVRQESPGFSPGEDVKGSE